MQNYQPQVQPMPESTHPRQSGPKQSNTPYFLLAILVVVLQTIIIVALPAMAVVLLTKFSDAKDAARPTQTSNTEMGAEAEGQAESQSDTETDSSKQSDPKKHQFDYEAMAKGDYSSANGHWKAPNGDILIVKDNQLTWEHDGKPLRAAYPEDEANDVPKDLQANGFTAINEKDFFKIVWEADKDTPNGVVQIVFIDRPFTDRTIFTYKSTLVENADVAENLTTDGYVPSILLLKIDDPDNDSRPYEEMAANKVD